MKSQHSDIKFYQTGQAYDFFSNVTDVGISFWLDGQLYQTRSTEAVFQGMKAYASNRSEAQKLFSNNQTPGKFLQDAGKKFNSQFS